MHPHSNRSSGTQRGVALFMAIFALLLLSAVAMGLMYMTNTETGINANYRSSQQAYFGAVAGLQEVRERLTASDTPPHAIAPPTAMPGAPGSVLYVLNPAGPSDTVDPTNPNNPYFDDELCHENYAGLNLTNPGHGVPCTAAAPSSVYSTISSDSPYTNTSAALPFKWVRITLKANNTMAPYYVDGGGNSATYNSQVCWNGISEMLLPAGHSRCEVPPVGTGSTYKSVYVLTAYAKGSRRIAQMEVAPDPPLITNAAIDSQDHVVLNGQLTVIGYDYCSCNCTWSGNGSHQTLSCTNRTGKTCDGSKYAIYAAGSVDNPNSSELLIAGTTPAVAQDQVWPYDIGSLITRFKTAPGTVNASGSSYSYSCTGSPANCGSHSSQHFGTPPSFPPTPPDNPSGSWAYQVTYVPGSLQITGSSQGAGILIVDGDLDIHGGLQFYGLIMVRGVVSFTGGGSQNTNIYGAVLAGQESRVDNVLGGSADIQFDYCALPQGHANQPPTLIVSREVNY